MLLDAEGRPIVGKPEKPQAVFVTCDAPGPEWKVHSVLLVQETAADVMATQRPIAVAARTPTLEEMLFVMRTLVGTGCVEVLQEAPREEWQAGEPEQVWVPMPAESAGAFRLVELPEPEECGDCDAEEVGGSD